MVELTHHVRFLQSLKQTKIKGIRILLLNQIQLFVMDPNDMTSQTHHGDIYSLYDEISALLMTSLCGVSLSHHHV